MCWRGQSAQRAGTRAGWGLLLAGSENFYVEQGKNRNVNLLWFSAMWDDLILNWLYVGLNLVRVNGKTWRCHCCHGDFRIFIKKNFILFLIIFISFILSNFPGVTFYIFSVFVSDIHSLPLPLSHANRPCSQFTMHSYKIINISTLTSQVGGKWLVHSGTFDQDTFHIEQQQQSLVVSVYLVLAATIFRLLVLPPCQWWMLTRPHYAAGGQSDQESELLLSCNTLVHMCCIGSP